LDLGALNCGACSSNAEVYQEAKLSEKAEEEAAEDTRLMGHGLGSTEIL
jgi:hypothetical protein